MSAIELFWTKLGADGEEILSVILPGTLVRTRSSTSKSMRPGWMRTIHRRLSTFGQVAMRDTEWRALRSLKRT